MEKNLKFILVTLGWIIALYMAYIPIALSREYGFASVGWGLLVFCFAPVTLMVVGMVRRKSSRNRPRTSDRGLTSDDTDGSS